MIVRKIRPEEYKRVSQFCALAFEYALTDSHLSSEEMLAKIAARPESRQDLYWDRQWAAFEDDDRTMLSTFIAIPYRVHFDGHSAGMTGIGGVATLPEYRRRGGVRACFEKALPDMYEQGEAFSYLYPFSTAFYRKFGYELGCERTLYRLDARGPHAPQPEGSFHLLEPGSHLLADIRQVYESWQNHYNLMTLDEEVEYQWVEKADPFRDREYTYVYRSVDGMPKAVVTCRPAAVKADRTLDCTKRLWFTDAEGLLAVFHLWTRMQSDHSPVLFYLPEDVELGAILPEWSFGYIQRKRQLNGMVRVVNAEQVLHLARMRGEGELTISLHDEQILQNNGCFTVRFAPGRPNQVERSERAPDVSLSIQDFSRLICGRYDVTDWRWLPDVRCFCDPEKAAQVFYRKPMHITRYF